MKKMDYIFAMVVILLSVMIWIATFLSMRSGAYVTVYHEDAVIAEYDLYQDGEYTVHTSGDEYNILTIRDGQATVSDANCPDRLCVRQRAVFREGETIICLPHKLTFRIGGVHTEKSQFDAIAN